VEISAPYCRTGKCMSGSILTMDYTAGKCGSRNGMECKDCNKSIVDYTSSALRTPVTPFSPIGDAAYRQHAGRGPGHGHRQHAQKFGKDRACGSGDILADRQTHRQAYSSQYFATAPAVEVIIVLFTEVFLNSRLTKHQSRFMR